MSVFFRIFYSLVLAVPNWSLKFGYSEKATKIFHIHKKWKLGQIFAAFSNYLNFTTSRLTTKELCLSKFFSYEILILKFWMIFLKIGLMTPPRPSPV